jgi:dethiobiotin synthetase
MSDSTRDPPPGLLVCGTDTGVGKTTVACGLLRLARRRGLRLVPFKPAETGHTESSGGPSDAQRLCDAAALPGLSTEDICPFRFADPVAPSVAARMAGTAIDAGALLKAASALRRRGDALLVESAGGLYTPYGAGITSATLSELLDIDILLIAANRLGTINHTALALAEIHRRRLRFAGVVLVDTAAEPSPDRPHNAGEIQALTGVRPRGTLPHCSGAGPDEIADTLAAHVDLDGLLAGALA